MKLATPLLMILALFSQAAIAKPIVIDFNDYVGPTFGFDPYLEDGVRITPNCHWDINTYDNPNGSNWFGWDSAGCDTQPATLKLDMFGKRFHLLSFEVVQNPLFQLTSPRGGSRVIDDGNCDVGEWGSLCGYIFAGREWRNLTHLDFSIISDFGDPQGFDNLRLVLVPEPNSLVLGLGALLVTAVTAMRRRRGLRSGVS